jgi:hypothetical protein
MIELELLHVCVASKLRHLLELTALLLPVEITIRDVDRITWIDFTNSLQHNTASGNKAETVDERRSEVHALIVDETSIDELHLLSAIQILACHWVVAVGSSTAFMTIDDKTKLVEVEVRDSNKLVLECSKVGSHLVDLRLAFEWAIVRRDELERAELLTCTQAFLARLRQARQFIIEHLNVILFAVTLEATFIESIGRADEVEKELLAEHSGDMRGYDHAVLNLHELTFEYTPILSYLLSPK